EHHPLVGARLLVRSATLNSTTLRCVRVALEHHRGAGGEGYPALPRDWRLSLMSGIVAVADCSESLRNRRGPRGVVTPHEALGLMLGPFQSRFDPALLWALVQAIGFYPPGQRVELEDGSVALSLAPNPQDPARPHVRLVSGPG